MVVVGCVVFAVVTGGRGITPDKKDGWVGEMGFVACTFLFASFFLNLKAWKEVSLEICYTFFICTQYKSAVVSDIAKVDIFLIVPKISESKITLKLFE